MHQNIGFRPMSTIKHENIMHIPIVLQYLILEKLEQDL